MSQKLSYCGRMVRDHDPDRFLLSMFAPAERREALWALFAFNHEIAKTREVVSETQLGHIRLQWWRDEIGKIYEGSVSEHEVLKPLAAAVRAHGLPREDFETLIYAREFDLEDSVPANMEGLLHYADFTSTPLMRLALRCAGEDTESEPVYPVAVNYALAGLLRAVPFHAAQGRCYLPADLLAAAGIAPQGLYRLKEQEGLPGVVAAVAGQYVSGIREKSPFLRSFNVLAGVYMKQLQSCDFDVFSPKMARPAAFRELRLLWGIGRGV